MADQCDSLAAEQPANALDVGDLLLHAQLVGQLGHVFSKGAVEKRSKRTSRSAAAALVVVVHSVVLGEHAETGERLCWRKTGGQP